MSVYRTAWIPPPEPCAPWVVRVLPAGLRVLGYGVAVASFGLALSLAETIGCGAPQPSTAQEASVAAYAAEQEACITSATTLEESQACRLAVRARWGRK